jgi:hypothetical protein
MRIAALHFEVQHGATIPIDALSATLAGIFSSVVARYGAAKKSKNQEPVGREP